MIWRPSHLTREQMEERRLIGGRLLRAGRLSQAEIARQLGVSRSTVSDWAKQLEVGGWRSLRRRKPTGRPCKLTTKQQRQRMRLLKRGALAAGFPTERWTLKRIQRLLARDLKVTYHANYLARLLDRLGWSPQVPLPRARERDLLGRSLTTDEVRDVMNMARRIAAILLLEPALDANYQAVKQAAYAWHAQQNSKE